jgi:hypothetical protein
MIYTRQEGKLENPRSAVGVGWIDYGELRSPPLLPPPPKETSQKKKIKNNFQLE